ncbi:sensor histidine kinase [Pseudonocardia spinosispora]|uniref:sensor histidine kinase n=1 Tax=Pseudonocardia spinosispora TaxID=103441 RepID=UPI0004118D16|nr:nitrate- and nitrite sensing domain-containing protein [Pseudonocardia spinosispora]
MNGRHRALFADDSEGSAPGAPEQYRDHEPSLIPRTLRVLFRPTSIRAKLSRILVVALVLVLLALGFMVTGKLGEFRDAQGTSRIVTVTLQTQELVHSLQKERGLTNGLLGGGRYYQASVTAQRIQTDAALVTLNQLLDDPTYQGPTSDAVRTALGRLGDLASVRKDVDSGAADQATTLSYYTDATAALNDLDLGLDRAQDRVLRNGLQALYTLGDAKDNTDRERGLLNGVFSANAISPQQYQEFSEIRAAKQIALDAFEHSATPQQRSAVDDALQSPVATRAAEFEELAAASVTGVLARHVDAQNHWWNQMTLVINDLHTVQQSIGTELADRADALRNAALRELIAYLVAAAIGIAIQVALVIGAARSIIGPLGALAAEADDVSANRLPKAVEDLENPTDDEEIELPRPVALPVPEHAGTEIRQLARAVSRLQESALTLATEQALIRRNTTASLANLGRRNQNLVRRQLGLISEFEREELDPSTLANMFELDHLATRMRRNAESLLVLVGESGPKTWSSPLSIYDVVRASLSEVEGYQRVSLKRIDDVHIAGSVVTDLAHMLAELIENGLAYSPPGVEVEIYGRRMGSRYTIAVVDHGAGMQPDALVKANARLHDEENFLVAPTRFLGHYVVGRLARQLGVEVTLAPAPITGITARMLLPSIMLVDPAGPDADQPTVSVRPVGYAEKPNEADTEARGPQRTPVRTLSAPADAVPTQQGATTGAPMPRQERPAPAQRVRVDVSSERTRNGLAKRQAKSARPKQSTPALRPAAQYIPPKVSTPERERSPSDVSSMLSAFRAGHQRAAQSGVERDIYQQSTQPAPAWASPAPYSGHQEPNHEQSYALSVGGEGPRHDEPPYSEPAQREPGFSDQSTAELRAVAYRQPSPPEHVPLELTVEPAADGTDEPAIHTASQGGQA